MPKVKITATFPDGTKLRRTTSRIRASEQYTHAWRVCWLRPLNDAGKPVDASGNVCVDRAGSESGFASSYNRAAAASTTIVNRISSYKGYEITKHDIVPLDV